MSHRFLLLSSFSHQNLLGNPTPVCVLEKKISAGEMHSLTLEFNAPVSTFIEPVNEEGAYPIRYFTSRGEIAACGHASLAAAFVLSRSSAPEELILKTIEEVNLKARKEDDLIFIEYPRYFPVDLDTPQAVEAALGIRKKIHHFYCEELQTLFIELENEEEVKKLSPDFRTLEKSSNDIKEVVVMSASSNKEYDFVLRSFCPWIGIDEDPVTGSIHSVLADFWKNKTGKLRLTCYQASERGGLLHIRAGDQSVEIGGNARFVLEGNLL